MDFDLKQWRLSQHQSEQPPALPLFVSEPNARISNLSAFQDSSITTTTTTSRLPRSGAVFSIAQIQELELQVLIFKYILAGADVPVELLQSIKSLININTSPAYLYHPYQQYQHYQPYVLHSGYWGRNSVDPEPGRCRRTDGKKWRCSRDVVVGQKYCERHVNRGRNRSRKPVEITTPAGLKTADSVAIVGASFAHSKPSPLIDLIQLNQRSSETKMGNEIPLEARNIEGSKPEGQLLRHFFDERPKLHKESNGVGHNASPSTSTTGLSISIPRNHSSDFSLKLSTGNADGPSSGEATIRAERSHQSWVREWATQPGNYTGGGLLSEMLRSSTSNSPTSVLRELRRRCVSETSSVST